MSRLPQHTSVSRLLGGLCCALLAFTLSGGQWLALQTAAWTRMIVVYSQQDGLVRGVTKTFDGEHPCSLCTSITRATAEERTDQDGKQKSAPTESVWAAIVTENAFCPPALQRQPLTVLSQPFSNLVHSPPTPPPRA